MVIDNGFRCAKGYLRPQHRNGICGIYPRESIVCFVQKLDARIAKGIFTSQGETTTMTTTYPAFTRFFISWCVFALFSSSIFAAQITGSGVKICENGYLIDNGSTCVSYAKGNCDTGYYELPANTGSFMAPSSNNLCTTSSYTKYTNALDVFDFTYTGIILGDAVTLCDNGYSTDSSTCTSYVQSNCENNFHRQAGVEKSFVDVSANDTCDTTGFTYYLTLSDVLINMVYNGVLIGTELTLCDNGYSPDSTTCTTYAAGYCPTGYFDLDTDDGFITLQSAGTCATGYGAYNGTETCGYNPTMTTCLDLCENGQMTTELGTCATMCSLGVTTLRTSNGLVIPMWSSAQSSPALNIGVGNGVCYVNLESGTGTGINVEYDNTSYHVVK